MPAASNMSRITLLKSSFSFGVSSHLVRGSLSFTSSSASIFSLFGFICVRQGSFSDAVDTSADSECIAVKLIVLTLIKWLDDKAPFIHRNHILYQLFGESSIRQRRINAKMTPPWKGSVSGN